MRFLAGYIMQGRMQAIMVAATLALISLMMPPVSVLSSASVALVTLRKGLREGVLVLLIAAVVAALLGALLFSNPQFAIGYGLILWLPILLMAMVLRVTQSLVTTIETAVCIAILMVVGFYAVVSNPADLWQPILNKMIMPLIETAPEDVPIEQIKLTIERAARFMTGMLAAGSVFGMLLGLMLARWWQSQLFNPGGFGQEFTGLKTSPKFALMTLAAIAVALVAGGPDFAWNVSIPLFVLYTFIGTAVFHVLLATRKNARVLIPVFYGVMFMLSFVTPFVIMPIAFIGISDIWLDLRKKFSNQTNQS